MPYNIGDSVMWEWGEGTAHATIKKKYTSKVSVTIKGNEVTRNADDENPAYLLQQKDGSKVLKSQNELSGE